MMLKEVAVGEWFMTEDAALKLGVVFLLISKDDAGITAGCTNGKVYDNCNPDIKVSRVEYVVL